MSTILELMKTTGAIMEGHFLLSSGLHSGLYLEKFRLMEDPEILEEVGRLLADGLQEKEVDVVVGAAVGGILLSHAVATVLGKRSIFAERVGGKLGLRRGFELKPGEKVVVIEDIVTTGGSVKELVQLVENSLSAVVAIAYLVDRTENGIDFGYPATVLWRYPVESWEAGECPLCEKGVPLEVRGRTGKRGRS